MPSTDQKQGCSPKKNGSSRLDKARKQDAYNQRKNSELRESKQGKKRQQMSRKTKKKKIDISTGNAHNTSCIMFL